MMRSLLISSVFLSCLSTVLCKDLVEIRPSGSGGNRKRGDASGLDLKSAETFLWGDAGEQNALASLTVYMPGDEENILSMEHFDGMLTSVNCGTDKIEMTFEDDAAFAYAEKVWDWVNGADNNSFVMVAGVGDCGENTRRIPYVVSTIAYDEEANKATLTARQTTWAEMAHSYDLVVGQVSDTAAVRVRDISKSTSVDFTHNFPFNFAVAAKGLEGRLQCTECGSKGSFEMEFKISQKFFVPTGASMKLKPKGVSAVAKIKLSGSGTLTDSLSKEFDIIEIPISGIKIPGILDLGPFFSVSVGAELSSISLTASVTSGATAKLDNAAILEVDLLNPDKNKFSGWTPSVELDDIKVDASISGGVAVFLKPQLELQAEALGKGFSIGLVMKLPNISAKLSALASNKGACPAAALRDGAVNKALGVNIAASIGASLNLEAKKSSSDDPLFTLKIASFEKPLAQVCFPFGKAIAARSLDVTPRGRYTRRPSIA